LEAAGVRADRLLREKDLEAENARVSLKMEFEYRKANELKSANARASVMHYDVFTEIEDLERTLSSKISECEATNSRAAHDLLLQSQKREELIQSKSQALELKHQLSMQKRCTSWSWSAELTSTRFSNKKKCDWMQRRTASNAVTPPLTVN
jgi:hypothetical protein